LDSFRHNNSLFNVLKNGLKHHNESLSKSQ
jgi:hypothetical protein